MQGICLDMHAFFPFLMGKSKNYHHDNMNIRKFIFQRPCQKEQVHDSEINVLFQTGKCQTEASTDTLKGHRGHPIHVPLPCNKNSENP